MPAIVKTDISIQIQDSYRNTIINNPTYAFISGLSQWTDELEPPTPVDSTEDEYEALSDLVGIKRITVGDTISVVPRNNWQTGKVFDQYDHTVDLINTRNPETGDFYRFYVITQDFNVYKCISNNYRALTTTRPTGTSPEPFRTPDGYVWKYMYTVQANDSFKFMTTNWMPCYTLLANDGSAQWVSQQAAVPGTLDAIRVIIKGAGYSAINPPSIIIDGDGTGAVATADVNPITGEIDDIIVVNPGQDYTYANITISDLGGSGVGATARSIIGPRKGHGADPRSELGATYLMLKVTLNGDEGGLLPTNIEYRRSGIISNPRSNTLGYIIKIGVSESILFKAGETITGGITGATADIVQVDTVTGELFVTNVVGSFSSSENISSQAYNESSIESISTGYLPLTGSVYGSASLNKQTGEILFISNREKITRVENQKEDIVAIISF